MQKVDLEYKDNMQKNNGQIGIGYLVGGGITIAVALASSFLAQINITQDKIDTVNQSISADASRISAVEQKSNDIDTRLTRIENKLDKLLENNH